MVKRASINGAAALARRGRALDSSQLGSLLHAGMLRQMREKQGQIPRDSGRLKASILSGQNDVIEEDRASLVGLEYGLYVDLPKIDEGRLIREAAGRLFRSAGID